MKTKKKALTLALCAVLLVGATFLGTLAYLTDDDAVTNTFTVGQVHIELDEADVKLDGTIDTNDRVKENDYHLIPGHTYIKDPTVTVKAGSEETYVRMFVEFNYSSQLDAIFPNADLTKIFNGYEDSNWAIAGVVENETANTRTYEFRYVGADYKGTKDGTVKKIAENEADVKLDALFDSFTLPGVVTKEQLATLVTKDNDGKIINQFTIKVTAEAIQADGFANANAAWGAWTN